MEKIYEFLEVTAEKFVKGQRTLIGYLEDNSDIQIPSDGWVEIEGERERNDKRSFYNFEPDAELMTDVWVFGFRSIGQHNSITFLDFLSENGWDSVVEGYEQQLVELAEKATREQDGKNETFPRKVGTFVTLWECWTERFSGYEYEDYDNFCKLLGRLDMKNRAVIEALKNLVSMDTKND